MYLAHRGYKVANYALVPDVPFPEHYVDGLNLFVVGLTNDPKRLSVVRKTRQIAQSDESNKSYTDVERITQEIRDARRLFTRRRWPVIDVTRRSVEETAAAVIQLTPPGRSRRRDGGVWCRKVAFRSADPGVSQPDTPEAA